MRALVTRGVTSSAITPALLRQPAASASKAPDGDRWLSIILGVYLLWGVVYIARTTLTVDGQLHFCLWDDGMISMRYARNLAHGHGLVWNAGGDRVQGFSNLGVTLMMAVIHLSPVRPAHAALFVQLANLALCGWLLSLVHGTCARLFPHDLRAARAATIGAATLAPLHVWSLQGSDVGFVSVLLMAAIASLAAKRDGGSGGFPFRVLPILGLGVVVRTDFALPYLVVLVGATAIATTWRAKVFGAASGVALLAAIIGGLMLFGQLYYGDPLPNTFYLKSSGSPRLLVWQAGWQRLAGFLVATGPAIAVGLGGFACFWRKDRLLAVCWTVVLAQLLYEVHVGGDWLPQYSSRFAAPALPIAAMLIAGATTRLLRGLVPGRAACAATIGVGALLAGPGLSPPVAAREWLDPRVETMLHSYNQRNLRLALFLKESTLPETVIGVFWAGVPGYFSERSALDVLGKSDRHIAKLVVARFIPAHSKWDWDYVMRCAPDIMLGANRGLQARADFRERYAEVTTRAGRLYMRRDAQILIAARTSPAGGG